MREQKVSSGTLQPNEIIKYINSQAPLIKGDGFFADIINIPYLLIKEGWQAITTYKTPNLLFADTTPPSLPNKTEYKKYCIHGGPSAVTTFNNFGQNDEEWKNIKKIDINFNGMGSQIVMQNPNITKPTAGISLFRGSEIEKEQLLEKMITEIKEKLPENQNIQITFRGMSMGNKWMIKAAEIFASKNTNNKHSIKLVLDSPPVSLKTTLPHMLRFGQWIGWIGDKIDSKINTVESDLLTFCNRHPNTKIKITGFTDDPKTPYSQMRKLYNDIKKNPKTLQTVIDNKHVVIYELKKSDIGLLEEFKTENAVIKMSTKGTMIIKRYENLPEPPEPKLNLQKPFWASLQKTNDDTKQNLSDSWTTESSEKLDQSNMEFQTSAQKPDNRRSSAINKYERY